MTKLLDILLPVIGCGLLLVLIIVMVRRKLHREYPFFFGSVAFALLISVALAPISNSKSYVYAYWTSEAFNTVLVLLALNEVFYEVFRGFYSFWWFRLIFPGEVAVISFLAIREAVLKPFSQAAIFPWVVLSVESALSFVRGGLLLALLLLTLGLRAHWRRYPFYIALGFAVSGAGEWVAHAMLSEFGNKFVLITRYVPPSTYICATLIWLWSFSGKFEAEPKFEFGTTTRKRAEKMPIRTETRGSGNRAQAQ